MVESLLKQGLTISRGLIEDTVCFKGSDISDRNLLVQIQTEYQCDRDSHDADLPGETQLRSGVDLLPGLRVREFLGAGRKNQERERQIESEHGPETIERDQIAESVCRECAGQAQR